MLAQGGAGRRSATAQSRGHRARSTRALAARIFESLAPEPPQSGWGPGEQQLAKKRGFAGAWMPGNVVALCLFEWVFVEQKAAGNRASQAR